MNPSNHPGSEPTVPQTTRVAVAPSDAVVRSPAIGLTLGDPSGIGPEVMIAALAATRLAERMVCRLYVPQEICAAVGDWLGRLGLEVSATSPVRVSGGHPDALVASGVVLHPIAAVDGIAEAPPLAGQPTAGGRSMTMRSLAALLDAACAGQLDAIATGPAVKAIFDGHRPDFPGQTEYVAWRLGVDRFAMMLAGPALRVVPVTTHMALRDVAQRLDSGLIVRAVEATVDALRRWYGISQPRLAVCGLNPHAGEGGRMGDEEPRIIVPALTTLVAAGHNVVGPVPADTAFHHALSGRYDAVVCMYHDQALGPLKTVHFADAINVTCGLPIPRVSPDHGTAWDIAGRGEADSSSAIAALELAGRVAASKHGVAIGDAARAIGG